MIYRTRGTGIYVVALAVFGCLAVAGCQSNRPATPPSASIAVAAAPASSSCVLSPAATASLLRSQGFTAQAANNFVRLGELDCASGPASACAAESASALRDQGFSAQAVRNLTRRDQGAC
jgi:hypothetical protein